MNRFSLIIPAAGSGSRSGSELPKQYVALAGEPVLAWTLRAFLQLPECVEVVVAIDEAWRDVATECAGGDTRVHFVAGGNARQHSIAAALTAMRGDAPIILVHDAARPCVDRSLVERVVAAASAHGAAVPVWAIAETVKRVDAAGYIVETVPRSELRLAQTPQGFDRALLERAYRHAAEHGTIGTDDASLVESLGEPVHTVAGDPHNLKITLPEDFARAADILAGRSRSNTTTLPIDKRS